MLKTYVEMILKNFKDSEAQGYRSKDRQYAIEMLEKGLERSESRSEKEIWNEAIDAAADEADKDHGSYCEEVGNDIRKLKK